MRFRMVSKRSSILGLNWPETQLLLSEQQESSIRRSNLFQYLKFDRQFMAVRAVDIGSTLPHSKSLRAYNHTSGTQLMFKDAVSK